MRVLLLAGAVLAFAPSASAAVPRVLAIHFDAEVNPVTQNYLCHNLSQAAKDGYAAAVIVLDTPGGLVESKDKIVLCELNAKLPVLVWVGPDGATAGSAGVWIAQAADWAWRRRRTSGLPHRSTRAVAIWLGSSPQADQSPRGGLATGTCTESRAECPVGRSCGAGGHQRQTAEEALKLNVIEAVAPTIRRCSSSQTA